MKLDRVIESPMAVNGKLSLDDIRVLPLLRSTAVVKGLRFPRLAEHRPLGIARDARHGLRGAAGGSTIDHAGSGSSSR